LNNVLLGFFCLGIIYNFFPSQNLALFFVGGGEKKFNISTNNLICVEAFPSTTIVVAKAFL
jgi:hypothetical protein